MVFVVCYYQVCLHGVSGKLCRKVTKKKLKKKMEKCLGLVWNGYKAVITEYS